MERTLLFVVSLLLGGLRDASSAWHGVVPRSVTHLSDARWRGNAGVGMQQSSSFHDHDHEQPSMEARILEPTMPSSCSTDTTPTSSSSSCSCTVSVARDFSTPPTTFQTKFREDGVAITTTTMHSIHNYKYNSIPPQLSNTSTTAAATTTTIWTMALTMLGGIWVTSLVLSELLEQFEWMQSWRYVWPFGIGALYMLLNTSGSSTTNISRNSSLSSSTESLIGTTIISRAIFVFLGLGLMVGGAYDAWMPVYETGPNVITAAGIGQDAAMGLFGTTVLQIVHRQEQRRRRLQLQPNDSGPTATHTVLHILLLAELYKLGEGSFDELLFSHFS